MLDLMTACLVVKSIVLQALASPVGLRVAPSPARLSRKPSKVLQADSSDPLLRPCQRDCLEACAKGARVVEMACGTGKTRVMKELVRNISGRQRVALFHVLWPSCFFA